MMHARCIVLLLAIIVMARMLSVSNGATVHNNLDIANKSIPLTLHCMYYDDDITSNRTFARGERPLRDIVVDIVNKNHSVLLYYNVTIEMHMSRFTVDGNIGPTIETFYQHIVGIDGRPKIECLQPNLLSSSNVVRSRQPPLPLFFGPEVSSEAKVIGQLTPLYNLVSISPEAASADLNDRTKYPNFFRLIVSGDAFVHIPRALLTYLNYSTVGLIYMDGALGTDTMQAIESDLRAHQFNVLYREVYVPGDNDSVREFSKNAQLYDARVFVLFSNDVSEYKMFCHAILTQGIDVFTSEKYLFIFLMMTETNMGTFIPSSIDGFQDCTQNTLDRLLNGSFAAMMPTWDNNYYGPLDMGRLTIPQLRQQILDMSRSAEYNGDENITNIDDCNSNVADSFWTGILALDALDRRLRTEQPVARSLLDFTFDSADITAMLKEEITNVRFRGATGNVQFDKQTGGLQVNIPINQYTPNGEKPYTLRFNYMQDSERLDLVSPPFFATRSGQPPPDRKPPSPPYDEAAARRQLLTIIFVAIAMVVFVCLVLFGSVYMYNKRKLAKSLLHPNWLFHRGQLLMRSLAQSQSSLYGGGSVGSAISLASGETKFSNEIPTFPTALLKDGGLVVRLQQVAPNAAQLQVNEKNHKLLTNFRDNILHVNVVRFVGYCGSSQLHRARKNVCGDGRVEFEQYLLWEHCEKGTLEELIDNAAFKIDAMFEYALLLDVAQGMAFLHQSKPASIIGGAHGKLTPASCFIDRRFSVKVAYYGEQVLSALFEAKNSRRNSFVNYYATDSEEQQLDKQRLYYAPEMLRQVVSAPKSTPPSDVYAFAMTMYAVTTRLTPFESGREVSLETMTAKEILELVRIPQNPPRRPSLLAPPATGEEQMTALMRRCWSEQPNERPAFNDIVQQLRAMLRTQGGKSGVGLTDQLLSRLEKYASDMELLVAERTSELESEKSRSDELLNRMLPTEIVMELKRNGHVQPESFDSVTIYFSDIVGFTTISSTSSPIEVVNLLNALYTMFDAEIESFDAYKVETIGDAYMVVSGLPRRNGDQHTAEIARLSLALLAGIKSFVIPHRPMEKLMLRIGLHTGPCVAGVVGIKMPRYCLFGDTVNTASRMESNGEALKIHISHRVKIALDALGGFQTYLRGQMEIKGKGTMETYWLIMEDRSKK